MSDVALVKGDERRQNILKALDLIEDQINLGERIVVKPNMVSVTKPLSGTHAEALDAAFTPYSAAWFDQGIPDPRAELIYDEGTPAGERIKIYRWLN